MSQPGYHKHLEYLKRIAVALEEKPINDPGEFIEGHLVDALTFLGAKGWSVSSARSHVESALEHLRIRNPESK